MRVLNQLAILGIIFLAGPAAAACPGYTVCPLLHYTEIMNKPPALALKATIDATESAALQEVEANGVSGQQLLDLLGEVLVFDKSLSVANNEACALCHAANTGFAGGLSVFTRAGGVFPGSVTRRTGFRAPLSLAYAAYAPVLSYNKATQAFAGGNFWDSRATGLITGNPAADQATMPFTNPLEMGLPDPACVIRRVSLSPYASVFTEAWGDGALAITWPKNTDRVCAHVNDGGNQDPLQLSPADRATATTSLDDVGLSIAAYEASSLASPFTSKYDLFLVGQATLTKSEANGLDLFRGRANCSQCHAMGNQPPLFTEFTSFNIGTPRNPELPYLTENAPDKSGYIANPAGPAYLDEGLGGYLTSTANTNKEWRKQAPRFVGTFQVPTLRNVAAVPQRGYRRAYGHNGFFNSLKLLVHFYNTRDVLPQCTGNTGIGVTCWPPPEESVNENTQFVGNLGLSEQDERDIVAFMGTLTDGYQANQANVQN